MNKLAATALFTAFALSAANFICIPFEIVTTIQAIERSLFQCIAIGMVYLNSPKDLKAL